MTSTRYFIDNLDMEINVVAKIKGDATIPGHLKIKNETNDRPGCLHTSNELMRNLG